MLNLVNIIGRIVKDVELIDGTKPFIKFSLAINNQKNCCFVPCISFQNFDNIIKDGKKGNLVLISGYLSNHIRNEDGKNKNYLNVTVTNFMLLNSNYINKDDEKINEEVKFLEEREEF